MKMDNSVYEIPYHHGFESVSVPGKNVLFYGSVQSHLLKTDNLQQLREALKTYPLENVTQQRRVCLIVEDSTREVPLDEMLEATSEQLARADNINVLVATGTHDGRNEANQQIVSVIKKTAQKAGWNLGKITIHDCHHGRKIYMGKTDTLLNDVFANSEIEDAEVFVTFSDMKNHYFAGYSNALKNFLPGICAYETVERNHALAMDEASTFGRHPLHPDKKRRNNPLAQDIWEGYRLIVKEKPVYLVATITEKNRILWSGAGFLQAVLPEGIRMVDQLMSLKLKKADYLIVSCGGYPNDESLYSAQRALELTKNAVCEGGEILFLAACGNGIGPQKSIENFYRPLTQPIDAVLEEGNINYRMYAHKPFKFAQLIRSTKVIYLKSMLPDKEVTDIHLQPVENAQDVIDNWLRIRPDCTMNILTQGNKVAVHV